MIMKKSLQALVPQVISIIEMVFENDPIQFPHFRTRYLSDLK